MDNSPTSPHDDVNYGYRLAFPQTARALWTGLGLKSEELRFEHIKDNPDCKRRGSLWNWAFIWLHCDSCSEIGFGKRFIYSSGCGLPLKSTDEIAFVLITTQKPGPNRKGSSVWDHWVQMTVTLGMVHCIGDIGVSNGGENINWCQALCQKQWEWCWFLNGHTDVTQLGRLKNLVAGIPNATI